MTESTKWDKTKVPQSQDEDQPTKQEAYEKPEVTVHGRLSKHVLQVGSAPTPV